ncbi:MAG: endolytic transglycosylase MltG [Firmicutes bacterium]|nr:endolytic transglycosylase MltG [Bacillota bacterium]
MRKGKKLLAALGLLLLLVAAAAGVIALQVHKWLQPVPAMAAEPVLVTIPAGASSTGIAKILADQGLIHNATVFRFYAKYRGLDQKLQAGNYLFRFGMTMDEILEQLIKGDVYRPTVTVTIPEGFNLEQIAKRIQAQGLADYDEFMELARLTVPALGQVKDGQRYAVEGYLFPDTYEFDVSVTPKQILDRMLARLEEVFTAEMRSRCQELGLEVHDVMTLAALVEREAQVAAERELIAGVMHNRLQKKMPLQIDASVIYALGEHQNVVLLEDLKVDSPYNTYKYPGLPPGPIASPGKAAIMAVLYPAETDYLYYVAKGDGSGEHYFGRTLAEHNANIKKANENRKR